MDCLLTESQSPRRRRFTYRILCNNTYGVVWALSRVDALQQVALSEHMPYLRYVEWLTD